MCVCVCAFPVLYKVWCRVREVTEISTGYDALQLIKVGVIHHVS